MSADQIFLGLKVVDLASFIAGPAAATILSDFGADVIKVEPPDGELWRNGHKIPPQPHSEEPYPFELANRNKRGIALNLKATSAQQVLERLAKWADVFIVNTPHTARKKLKLEYDDVAQWNPRLIYADLTGFGEKGPDATLPGFDLTAFWARSGLLFMTRDTGEPPTWPVAGSGDNATAVAIYGAIVTALYRRERTGKGSYVTTSLLAAGVWSASVFIQAALCGASFYGLHDRAHPANAGLNTYRSSDGTWFVLVVTPDKVATILKALDREDILTDSRFSDPAKLAQRTAGCCDRSRSPGRSIGTRYSESYKRCHQAQPHLSPDLQCPITHIMYSQRIHRAFIPPPACPAPSISFVTIDQGHSTESSMRIVQTVFGVFHHFELARELNRRGHLQKIYSTYPWRRLKREEIPHSKVETFPWFHTPEMLLLRMNLNIYWLRDPLSYANALTFDAWTSRLLRRAPTPDVLIALSGSSLRTGRELQVRGTRMVCDRGSSHQRYQEKLVTDEYRRWGVKRPVTDFRDIHREEEIYQFADAISVPSHFAARSFVEMGLPPEKIHVIPYGVRLERFTRTAEPPSDRFEVLFVGFVGLRKGIPYLLEAFAKLRHPGKRLRIVGPMHPDIKSVLPRLPVENVEFLGPVPNHDLHQIMTTSHLMVLPSIEEGLALVQGQALACGCPVLSSTNTGAEDLFTDNVEGFIVPIRDVNALTEKMQLLADDPALQQRMSEAALRRVQTLGGWQDYGNRWQTLLEALTAAN